MDEREVIVVVGAEISRGRALLYANAQDLLLASRSALLELIELYERAYPDDESDNDTTAAIDRLRAVLNRLDGIA
jgi:hypothetical protein